MTARINQESFEQALRNAFTAIRELPAFCGDVAVTTSSAVLFTDAATTNGYGTRRVTITNTHATNILGIKILEAGATATGHAIENCKKIMGGQTWEIRISSGMRLAAVGSGSLTANVLVEDWI